MLAALILIGKHYIHNNLEAVGKPVFPTSTPPSEQSTFRLSRDVVPEHYDLTLLPNVSTGSYSGYVNITISVKKIAKVVTLHSSELVIRDVSIAGANLSRTIGVQNVEEDVVDQTISVIPKGDLVPGVYFLRIEFEGNMLNRTKGLYRSTHADAAKNGSRFVR